MRRIQRALISVYDKTGIVEFAKGLSRLGVELLATGSTHKLLTSNGVQAREVSDFTGFPEILGGRVKTLHPKIAGGLLAIRQDAEHMRQAEANGIALIDLVCVNLYPFVETIRKPDATFDQVIENIDIGGPTMIRAAAKNFQDVAVLTSPSDYTGVLQALDAGGGVLPGEVLFELAQKAFLMTARYDAQIAQHLSRQDSEHAVFPKNLFLDFEKVQPLRYGENPHQRAAFYRWGGQPHGLADARQLQGPELSYNNLVDLDAAWALVHEFAEPACCLIKHTNPCGAAIGRDLAEAYVKAYEADSLSAFGSVIAVNRPLDAKTAAEMAKLKIDVVAAPAVVPDALEILARKKNTKLVVINDAGSAEDWAAYVLKTVSGGILIQDADRLLTGEQSRAVTSRKPSPKELLDLDFAWRIVKHIKSNAIVLARDGRTTGVGAGQMSRVDSVRISVEKAGTLAQGSVLASDAFFPFRDGVEAAAEAGVTAIIQPGGSVKDPEIIEAAEAHGMAMIFTGLRHFRH